jgi:NAD(P)-dependent dehydrogenase (short-subunit alcohol dehydrogenase family)
MRRRLKSEGRWAAAPQIEDRTERKQVAEVWELDMDRYSSISQFAARVNSELPGLDIAILNAGVISKEYIVALKDRNPRCRSMS